MIWRCQCGSANLKVLKLLLFWHVSRTTTVSQFSVSTCTAQVSKVASPSKVVTYCSFFSYFFARKKHIISSLVLSEYTVHSIQSSIWFAHTHPHNTRGRCSMQFRQECQSQSKIWIQFQAFCSCGSGFSVYFSNYGALHLDVPIIAPTTIPKILGTFGCCFQCLGFAFGYQTESQWVAGKIQPDPIRSTGSIWLMAEILQQLRLVVNPMIYKIWYIPGGAGFSSINSMERCLSLVFQRWGERKQDWKLAKVSRQFGQLFYHLPLWYICGCVFILQTL